LQKIVLFGRSNRFSPLGASKSPLVHTVIGFVICSRVSLSHYKHTQLILTTLWPIPTHPHKYRGIICPIGSIKCWNRKQE